MRRYSKAANVVLLAFLVIGTAACGGELQPAAPASLDRTSTSAMSEATPATENFAAAAPTMTTAAAAGTESFGADGAHSGASAPVGEAAEKAPALSVGSTGSGDAATSGSASGNAPAAEATPVPDSGGGYRSNSQSTYQSPITAGKVNDNLDFTAYLEYLHSYAGQQVHPIPVDQRLFLKVTDSNQQPVAGARVQLFDGQRQVFNGETVSDGTVLFFPEAADATQARNLHAVVTRGQAKVEADNITAKDPPMRIVLGGPGVAPTGNSGPVGLDLVFLLDSTGSMGDEIDKIKATVGSIASRIEQLPGSSTPRFGLVTYRDRGDDYITRAWDFTGSIDTFSNNLGNVQAGGGGDEPESVNAGLHDAIHLPGWADNSTGRHLRMIVLVGDAPPHLDYANDYEYTDLLKAAVTSGIKIFPIGASGLNDQGEYIFRQFAQFTQGQFVFLTYANGVSGAPGVATDHHVSNYSVQNLDSLVVSLVADEIANQTGKDSGASPGNAIVPVAAITTPPGREDQSVLASVLSIAGVWAHRLQELTGWLIMLLLPLVLLGAWLWKRRPAQPDLQRDLASVDFLLSPAPTTDLSVLDLPAAARLEIERQPVYPSPSPTLPVEIPLPPGYAVWPVPGQSTVALACTSPHHAGGERVPSMASEEY